MRIFSFQKRKIYGLQRAMKEKYLRYIAKCKRIQFISRAEEYYMNGALQYFSNDKIEHYIATYSVEELESMAETLVFIGVFIHSNGI